MVWPEPVAPAVAAAGARLPGEKRGSFRLGMGRPRGRRLPEFG